ncbi:Alpha-L-fucosidase 2 [Cyphellophora attinorum]|uniref:Alpha-L-fucosidase 2 n=1 Tax=Cyphellophora attinorum TaxID=1664694 RepID=A0A0N1NVZ6_9EURO|nr:Alpha-L-fucosidase 2 [Phialophora attinorum]KPI35952.1 Alpha-L-fucosidase 2 [Phialophora attinorum]
MVAANNNTRLWYTEPAEEWTQALPIGNGRLGGMVFGDHAAERIQVNEESVWNGGYRSRLNQNAAETVTQVRELLVDEKVSEAQRLANLGMVSTPQSMRRYETLGDISIEFDGISEYTNGSYRRWLDLETAIAGVTFDINSTTIERELFVSAPDDLMVHRLTANGDQKLYSESGDTTLMTGTAGGFDPITFAAGLHGQTDGTVRTLGEFLIVENATEAIIYFAAATTYRVPDPVAAIKQTFSNVHEYTYEQLRQRHIDDYQALYNTCTLELDSTASKGTDLPTNERINATQAGETDLGLIALQFQYGRYLLISSSRPGTLPGNLQGIWNEDFQSEWGSNLHTPLFDLIETVRKNGAETARQMYNASGWVVHHNTDIWGDTSPQDRYPPATYWTLSSAWLCTHILEHYSHTGDTAFLLSKLDTLIGSIQFYLDTLQTYSMNDSTTFLVTNPSTSPENTFYVPVTNDTGSMTVGPTCDFQILRELFTGFLSAVATLPTSSSTVSPAFLTQINTTLSSFPPYQISARYPGVIQEWLHDYKEAEPGHRHISHLYALYPGTSIPPPSAPKHNATLWDAASKTLEYRLSNGGAGTGWSRAWTINWYARLLNGSALAENIFQFFNSSTYPNLFDAHPPFQIDGNFGFTAGVAEALMQSHFVDEEDGAREVWLLPALPEAWTDGRVAGLVARGGFVMDVQWSESKVRGVNVTSNLGGRVSVKYDVSGMGGNVTVAPLGNESYDGFQVLVEQGKFTLDTTVDGKYVFELDWDVE